MGESLTWDAPSSRQLFFRAAPQGAAHYPTTPVKGIVTGIIVVRLVVDEICDSTQTLVHAEVPQDHARVTTTTTTSAMRSGGEGTGVKIVVAVVRLVNDICDSTQQARQGIKREVDLISTVHQLVCVRLLRRLVNSG